MRIHFAININERKIRFQSGEGFFIQRVKIIRVKLINSAIDTIKIPSDYVIALGKKIIMELLKEGFAVRNNICTVNIYKIKFKEIQKNLIDSKYDHQNQKESAERCQKNLVKEGQQHWPIFQSQRTRNTLHTKVSQKHQLVVYRKHEFPVTKKYQFKRLSSSEMNSLLERETIPWTLIEIHFNRILSQKG